jgi:tRNA nucleotidyltransferase (CCA-adding enzyme)
MADVMAQTTNNMNERIQKIERFRQVLNEVIEQQQCFSLKDLAINGWDLISIGVLNGKSVGEMLNALLNMVIEDEIINDKNVLLDQAKILMEEM